MRMARLAEPLMERGGSLITMSYLGAAEVVEHYGVMGPVKAALEASVRYLAAELGPRAIRVNAVSPGPRQTRAASGIPGFDRLMAQKAAAGARLAQPRARRRRHVLRLPRERCRTRHHRRYPLRGRRRPHPCLRDP
jgi:enoyl-[acyl-carrier protein] reductase I